MRSFRRASTLVGVAVLGAGLLTITTASGAVAAASCTSTYTWKVDAANSNWADAANWTVGGAPASDPPGTTSSVLIPSATHAPTAPAGTQICSLKVASGAALETSTTDNLSVSADATIVGGTSTAPTTITGNLDAATLSVSAGYVSFTGASTSESTVQFGAATHVALSKASGISARGIVTLGSGAQVSSVGDDITTSGVLASAAGIRLAGNATLDSVTLLVFGAVGTAGHTLTLTDDATGLFEPGSSITSLPAGGSVLIRDGAVAVPDGNATVPGKVSIGAGATLRVAAQGALASTYVMVGGGSKTAVLAGAGRFDWTGGYIGGQVILSSPLHVTVRAGVHALVDTGMGKTKLINKSAHFVLAGGSLDEQDANTAFRNAGRVIQSGGSLAAHSAAAPAFTNAAGARWTITARAGRTISVNGSLTNSGTLTVPAGVRLKVTKTLKQTSSGRLALKIAGRSASKHAAVVGRKLILRGALLLQSAKSYKPKAGVAVNSIVKGSSRHGTFTKTGSKTYRRHTKWTATYSTKSVTAKVITH